MLVQVLITIVHVVVCFFLIAVVLLQSGKSGDLAAAFGGQGSQTAFGPRGAPETLRLRILVRKGGLEPPCLLGATPSRWCVCQFHHFRTRDQP